MRWIKDIALVLVLALLVAANIFGAIWLIKECNRLRGEVEKIQLIAQYSEIALNELLKRSNSTDKAMQEWRVAVDDINKWRTNFAKELTNAMQNNPDFRNWANTAVPDDIVRMQQKGNNPLTLRDYSQGIQPVP